MLAHRGNSYCVRHAKAQQHSRDASYLNSRDAENIQPDKLLTDRSSYISYLESQLERLTNACLTVQSFDDRIQANAAAARALEEKVMNAGRLIKCSQSFSEETSSLSKKAISEIARRVSALEAAAPPSEAARMKWAADQEKLMNERLDSLEKRVMAKMDRAVQHCLAEQGLGPEAALPQVHARLQGVEDALQSVLAGRGSRADQRRSARMLKVASSRATYSSAVVAQAMDSLQRAYHQELSNLSAERAAFAASLDAARRSTEAHPTDADRAKALRALESVQRRVDQEVNSGLDALSRAEDQLDMLRQELLSASTVQAGTSSRIQHQGAAGRQQATQPAEPHAPVAAEQDPASTRHPQDLGGRADQPAPSAEHVEAQLRRQLASVQDTMRGIHSGFAAVRQDLQEGAEDPKLFASSRSADPSGLAAVQRMLHQQQSSRSAREAQLGAAPGHSLARTATGLSRDSGRSLRKSPTSSSLGAPRLHTAQRAEARAHTPDRPVRIPSGSSRIVHRTVERRKRLQQLYHELQALEDDSSRSNAR